MCVYQHTPHPLLPLPQVSGHACVHQRVRIGAGAFVAAAAVLLDDLLPYGLASGASRARLETLNLRGAHV